MKENLGEKLTKKEYAEIREASSSKKSCQSCAPCNLAARRHEVQHLLLQLLVRRADQTRGFCRDHVPLDAGHGRRIFGGEPNIEQLPQIAKANRREIADACRRRFKRRLVQRAHAWTSHLVRGKDIDFDLSLVRPAGSRLKTMGGKSSGPEPLRVALNFARERILKRQGRRLRTIDAHDIICKIGECVVAGGVRRSAMISLSDLDDIELRDAKKGQFYLTDPHRAMANNSAVYEAKPTNAELMDEWVALMKAARGERGIFNRGALEKTMPERRFKFLEKKNGTMKGYIGQVGTNPCGEIILQSKQFCNLSEIIARARRYEKRSFARRSSLRFSAPINRRSQISATFQKIGKRIAKTSDSLASRSPVSGIAPAVRNAETLKKMKQMAIKDQPNLCQALWGQSFEFDHLREALGHRLANLRLRLGIHPRHSQYYIRRIRITATDSLFKMLRDQGIPHHPEVGQSAGEANTYVLEFPVKAPEAPCSKTISRHRAARILENAQAQLDRTQSFRDDFRG
jgi:ribonucleoside-triphosphate reductase